MTVLLSLSSISLFEGSKNAARQSHIHLLLNSKDLGRSSEQRWKERERENDSHSAGNSSKERERKGRALPVTQAADFQAASRRERSRERENVLEKSLTFYRRKSSTRFGRFIAWFSSPMTTPDFFMFRPSYVFFGTSITSIAPVYT